jgi:hypothetical protein
VLNPAGPLAGDSVRASLDACGYQEGQQLSVQYTEGDPTQLSLAGTGAGGDSGTGGRLLPIGLVIAGLLAIAAGLAVWLDSRRGNRRPAHRGLRSDNGQPNTEPEQSAAASPSMAGQVTWDQAELDDDWPSLAGLGFAEADWHVEPPTAVDTGPAGRGFADVDLVFPSASSLADSLHDELFTHRSVYS